MNLDMPFSHQHSQPQQLHPQLQQPGGHSNREEHVVVPNRRVSARRSSSFMRRTPSAFKSSDTLDSIAEAGNYQSTKTIRRKSSQDLNVALGLFQQQQHQHQPYRCQPRCGCSDGSLGDEIGPPIFLEVDFDDEVSVDDVDESLLDLMDECTLGDECSWDEREIVLDDDSDSDDETSDDDDDDDSLYEHSYANDSRRIRIAWPNKLMNSDSFATHGSSNWSCMDSEDLSNTSFNRNDTIHHRSLPCKVVSMPSSNNNNKNGNRNNRRTVGASSSIKLMRTDSFSTIGSNMTAAQEANPKRFLTPANSFTAKGGNNDVDDHVTNMTCDLAAMTTRDFPVVQPVRSTVDPRKFQMVNRTMFKLPFGSSSSDLSHMTRGLSSIEDNNNYNDDDDAISKATTASSSNLSFMAQKKYQRIESPFSSPNPAVMTPSPKTSSPIRLPFRSDAMMHVPSLDHDHDQRNHDPLLGSLSPTTPTSPTRHQQQQQDGSPSPSMSPSTRFGGLRRKESIHRL
jgi:hypothetical protein